MDQWKFHQARWMSIKPTLIQYFDQRAASHASMRSSRNNTWNPYVKQSLQLICIHAHKSSFKFRSSSRKEMLVNFSYHFNYSTNHITNIFQFLAPVINAVNLAIMNSGIEMKTHVAAVQCFLTIDGKFHLDAPRSHRPSMISRVNKSLQSPSAGSYFLFVFESSADKKVVSVYTEGKFQAKQYTEAERLCRDACESVFQFYRDTTQRFASWFCKYFWKFVGNSLKWFCTKNDGQRQHAMISLSCCSLWSWNSEMESSTKANCKEETNRPAARLNSSRESWCSIT